MDNSIYAAYNARSLSISEICQRFVENEAYYKLSAPNHSLLIGPRGSGKTTLMRMLQVEALGYSYKSKVAHLDSIDYCGVFVPTDRLWKQQYSRLMNVADVDKRNLLLKVAGTLFTFHVISCICDSLRYRFSESTEFKSLLFTDHTEADVVNSLSRLWEVNPEIPSARSLSSSVLRRKSELTKSLSAVLSGDASLAEIMKFSDFSDSVQTISDTVREINISSGEESGKWVFLFDELELAPDNILKPLYQAMRGGPENIFWKLSLSPYNQNLNIDESETRPMPNHDYDVIRIPDVSGQSIDFARSLVAHVFQKNGYRRDVEEYFDEPCTMDVKEVFSGLESSDEGFSNYLKEHDIDVENIEKYGDKKGDKGPTIRKIKFIAQIRNHFRSGGRMKPRRSIPDFYLGFDNICKSVEYNPRMIIAISNTLISTLKSNGRISLSKQGESLRKIYESQIALYSSISVDGMKTGFSTINDFVEFLGNYFKDLMVGPEFNAEPPLTFIVNDDTYVELIGAALNVGALVLLPSDCKHDFGVDGPENTRCRLSYLMAHNYRLWLTSQGVCDLSRILKGTRNSVSKRLSQEDQLDLL
ncbi:hypothetical protein [Thalassolituus sp. UBA3500]|uniref:ORC-CDC6 family AAA ATPase n=1 Tax=Thalassolituus sp. UBA3500 TaxID=1947664 RepID=UPI000C1069A6|nr:hypothetical protein [Thalassolituus sp. UBA3500]MBN57553.1 hypothetical protein [Oceanospirillaceae bacterium]|tara:strand:- start:13311 stop:15068 length:1758 start_codon:yes stop_codon:yes gene_type:complete